MEIEIIKWISSVNKPVICVIINTLNSDMTQTTDIVFKTQNIENKQLIE